MNILKMVEKIVSDAIMYADMDEGYFWATSTISPKEAMYRARHYENLLEELKDDIQKLNNAQTKESEVKK